MASITSLMNSSSTSSIYGTRNIISGLASGMDTETMIENAVSGIKKKIQSLYQKRTKVQWQQEAYRSIIDKAVNLNNKYTSYSSKTNLLSSSFFNNAVITNVSGTYASKISASGKTTSDIKINAVKQMATAASYTVSGMGGVSGDALSSITGTKGVDLSADMDVSRVSGRLSLQYGGSNGTSFSLSFDELDIYDNAEDLAAAIRDKLGEQTWTYTKNGVQETVKGSDVIDVQVDDDGNITFSDKTSDGNSVYISSVSGDIEDNLGVSPGRGCNTLSVSDTDLSEKISTREYLSDKTLTFNLNGTSKTINLSDVLDKVDDDFTQNAKFQIALQDELDKAFGKGKVEVSRDQDGVMSFSAADKGSTLFVSGTAVKALGFESGDANYINTGKKLSDILGDKASGIFTTANRVAAVGDVTEKSNSAGTYYVDSKGNKVEQAEDGNYYQIDDTGKAIYDFEINGTHINVTEDTTLESLMNSINSNADMGVKVSYSKLTNEFKFTAAETGANSRIEFGGLAKDMFNPDSGVKSSDSFADAYGIDMTSRTLSILEPNSRWRTVDFNITDDMTEDEILSGLSDLFKEKGWDYTAKYEDGQLVITDGKGKDVDFSDSKRITFYDPDGKSNYTFTLTDDMTMQDIVDELNAVAFQPAVSDYTASFDEETGKIIATNRETGETVDIRVTDTGRDGEIIEHTAPSYSTYTAGTDAVMDVEINGVRFENLSRSSNSFDLDGLTVNVKGTFSAEDVKDGEEYEPITLETVTDTDKIIDAIRNFVNDYNEMITELKGAYSTQPAYNSSGNRYEPLTSDDESGMTESEIASYNETAKQGILFGDTTLSSMYSKLLNAIAPGGTDGQTLREIGIGTSYENGLTTISLDEDKLRTALEGDPDKVKNAFTKTTDGGSSSDGLMQTMQNTLNTYVRTTGEPKGVLVTRAGSVKAPTSLNNNSLNTQINNIDKQISRWQDKMSNQIDRYTSQFSKLEQLMAQMESQYSALAGLMGGTNSY